MSNIIYMLNNPKYELWRYDYLAYFYRTHSKTYDTTFCLALIMFDVMMITWKRLFYFGNLHSITWAIYYQLVVLNTDIYHRCRLRKDSIEMIVCKQKQLMIKPHLDSRDPSMFSIKHLFKQANAKWQTVHSLNHLDKGAFSMHYLKLLPSLSIRNRYHVITILDIFDKLIKFQQCLACE